MSTVTRAREPGEYVGFDARGHGIILHRLTLETHRDAALHVGRVVFSVEQEPGGRWAFRFMVLSRRRWPSFRVRL